jgi:hypothetical protein
MLARPDGEAVGVQWAATAEVVTGRRLVLFVALKHLSRRPALPPPEASATPPRSPRASSRWCASSPTAARRAEIGDELRLSHHTVRTHVRNAMDKLGARSARAPRRAGAGTRPRARVIAQRWDRTDGAGTHDGGVPELEPISLRFAFEVVGVCEAADLAAELRTLGHGSVQVRPVAPRFPSAVRWSVMLTIPPAPLRLDVLQVLEGEMRDVRAAAPGSAAGGDHAELAQAGPSPTG